MDRIQRLIRDAISQIRQDRETSSPLFTMDIKLTGHIVVAKFSNGRKQRLSFSQRDGRYLLTSVILRRGVVEKIGRNRVLPLIWQRNRETNLVAFTLDKDGCLIGSVEQLAETAEPEEIALYLNRLARECDELEYLLSGKDSPLFGLR